VAEPSRITVAVPTCNGAKHLVETLRSILSQGGVPFDLLVCDDRSSDDTLEVVKSEAGDRARMVVNSERLGLAGNWNRCVAECGTPLVAIVHQDDLLLPRHLASHVQVFDSAANVGLVASGSTVVDDGGRSVPETVVGRGGFGPEDRVFQPTELLTLMAPENPLRCSAVSIHTKAHEEVGGFSPKLVYVVDWEFWLRVSQRWSLAWLARESVAVRWHPASETHRFKSGSLDLEETDQVMKQAFARLRSESVDVTALEYESQFRLGRAYLNRAHVALRAGDGRLSRRCLGHALSLRPALLRTILADPVLAAQMSCVAIAPGLSARWFRRSS
jgi:glycosyltransferase involved in cell wall biosynthesis